jgi:rubrerythrin
VRYGGVQLSPGAVAERRQEGKKMSKKEQGKKKMENDFGYVCRICGCEITAAEGDDNDGMCEICAAPEEADTSEDCYKL